jgi:hypothetical protein
MVQRIKRLSRHPIRYFTEYLTSLLKEHGDEELIEKITFAVKAFHLRVTCHDDETFKRLTSYDPLFSPEFIKELGLKRFSIQYDVFYAVLKAIQDFEKQGITEFSLQKITDEVNKFPGERTKTRIKGVLWKFCAKLPPKDPWTRRYNYDTPDWLYELRGTEPVLEKMGFGVDEFRILPKPEPKLEPKKGKRSGQRR